MENEKMEWIKLSDRKPPYSRFQSNNVEDGCETYPVLLLCRYEEEYEMCVGILEKGEEDMWMSWLPGVWGQWYVLVGVEVTHWMELPEYPGFYVESCEVCKNEKIACVCMDNLRKITTSNSVPELGFKFSGDMLKENESYD